jgi:hypothetical protein
MTTNNIHEYALAYIRSRVDKNERIRQAVAGPRTNSEMILRSSFVTVEEKTLVVQ